ncbi:MAG: ATP synthase F1 subunit epsilon [Patescibacteria group bacterium]|nr:ATP synthase F1 subunit epsilon [Patescibacteria group bacterium]
MNKIHFQLVTPERTVLEEELDSLSCPTELGQITILPSHVPLVATITPGELIARAGEKEHSIAVSGGFVEIRPNNQVIVLADAAEHYYEIDTKRAEEAVKRAQVAMKEKAMSAEEYARVAASLQQSLSRLNIARKHSHRRTAPLSGEGVFKE